MLKFFFIILSAAFIAGGCSKDNTGGESHQEHPGMELPENVIDENVTRYFTEVTGSYIT